MGVLTAVLSAARAGAVTTDEVAARTGLDPGVVSAAVTHLRRAGHLPPALGSGCAAAGCAGCPVAVRCGHGDRTTPGPP